MPKRDIGPIINHDIYPKYQKRDDQEDGIDHDGIDTMEEHLTHDPPLPHWHGSRQLHCIHAVLDALPHNENVVLSPFSLISCMAMLCRGATVGPAREQLAHYCWPCLADGASCDDSVALSALSAFVNQLEYKKACEYANILMTDHANVEQYKNDISTYFKAKLYGLDEDDMVKVNSLVQEITHISKKVLPRKPTGTVLINAVYFADQWQTQFEKKLTSESFKQPTGAIVRVDMMHQKNRLCMANFEFVTAVHLDYKTDGLGAWFVKHQSDHTHTGAYKALEKFLQCEFIKKSLEKAITHVVLTVPKLTMNSSIDLRTLFGQTTQHQITHVFRPTDNLSRMSTDANEFVSRFEQECILKVDQEGTEASAYTASAALRSPNAGGPRYQYISFQHTFYMVIHHNDTILFVAKVASPTPSPPASAVAQKPSYEPKPVEPVAKMQKLNQETVHLPAINRKLTLDIRQHEGKDDEEGDRINATEKDTNGIPVYTYQVELDLLIRVFVTFPKKDVNDNTSIAIQPVYINWNGEEEPVATVYLKPDKKFEVPFPLQKEEGEGADGWDFKDGDGKTILKLRFII